MCKCYQNIGNGTHLLKEARAWSQPSLSKNTLMRNLWTQIAAKECSILRSAHWRASKFQHLTLKHATAGPSSNSRTALRTPEVEPNASLLTVTRKEMHLHTNRWISFCLNTILSKEACIWFYSPEVFVAGYFNKDKCNHIVHMFKFFNVRLFVPLSNLLHGTKTERKIVNLNIFSFKMHADKISIYPSVLRFTQHSMQEKEFSINTWISIIC